MSYNTVFIDLDNLIFEDNHQNYIVEYEESSIKHQ